MSEDKQAADGPIEKSATRVKRDEEPRRSRLRDRLSEADLRARSYWIGFAVGAVAVAVVLLVAWPLVDKYVWVRDDRGLGENFKSVMHPSPDECELIAEALYDHEVNVLQEGKHDGWAAKSEKAFWEGCS